MTRLTTFIREQIIQNAISKSEYPKLSAGLKEDNFKWADKLHTFANPENINLLIEFQKDIHEEVNEFFEQHPQFSGFSSGAYVYHARSGIYYDMPGGDREHISFADGKPSVANVKLSANNPLVAERYELDQRNEEISNLYEEIKSSVKTIVDSVNTVKRLLEIWPEAVDLLPKESAPKPPVPVVPVDSINKLLGL